MKRLLLFLFVVCSAVFLSAQSGNVIDAYNYTKSGKLDKALASIEPATTHPKTMNEPKTWLYRGNVYLALALTDDEKYMNLVEGPLDSAYNSYQKSISIDKEYIAPSANPPKAELGLYIIGEQYYNKGVEFFNKQEWALAQNYFEKTKRINAIFGAKDSLATYNATLCALQLGDKETASKYLKELVNMDYRNPRIYPMLADLYKESGDTAKMLGTVKIGRTRFPNDLGIIISETNYYLGTGQIEKAQELLQQAVEQDPENAILHFTIGSNYDKLARDTSINDEDKQKMIAEAEIAYSKAIEIKPDYFDAYYNMGALFFNAGVEKFDEASNIPPNDFDAYNKAKEEFEGYWSKAMPYLEEAHKLDPKDLNTLIALKALYARLSMPEKLKETNEKINALTK
jgi:tetratricopeptide (TPR) repeat protein